MKLKIEFWFIIFLIGLMYILWPGPLKVDDVPPLPNSLKSDEPGDTTQNPNIAAYFSDFERKEVTEFYRKRFSQFNFLVLSLPPLGWNHPPEEAFRYLRDQQYSSFVEQYFYPLRGSLFVSGWEPYSKSGKRFNDFSHRIVVGEKMYFSKTTIRLYSTSIPSRIVIYLLIWFSALLIFRLYRQAIKEQII